MLFSSTEARPSPSLFVELLSQWRVQALGGVIIGVALPYVTRMWISADDIGLRQLNLTVLWSAGAIILGTWLVRNVSVFPGVEASALLVPSFTIAFAVVAIILAVARLEYARSQLIVGYLLSIVWFFFVQVSIQRYQWRRVGYLPFGAVDNLPQVRHIGWIRLAEEGYPADPQEVVGRLDAVAVDLRVDLPDCWERTLSDFALAGVPVYHVKNMAESLTGRVQLEHLSENSFGSLVPNSSFLMIKRLIDWIAAVVVGIVLLPLFVLIAVIIRSTSPGPALFRQQRVGFRGRPFVVYKFRTMRVMEPNIAPDRDAAMTQTNDDRITQIGKFLRRSRIDELPQILNILRGEMSWIGPRPEAEILSRWYEAQIPFYRYRHIVRPGITGWAQVMQGHVAELGDVRDKLHYDFYYIKNFSPWMDILILARTVETVFSGFGAR